MHAAPVEVYIERSAPRQKAAHLHAARPQEFDVTRDAAEAALVEINDGFIRPTATVTGRKWGVDVDEIADPVAQTGEQAQIVRTDKLRNYLTLGKKAASAHRESSRL
jgi:hypothetical protein